MNRSFSAALDLQCRVLWALCLREIHGKHGRFRIGYLWQLIKTAFGVGVFWWVREMSNFLPPQGLSTPIFLLAGFIPWYLFSETLSMVMEAVRTNKALLTFPHVTPLDLYCSSAIVAAGTEIAVLGIFLAGMTVVGYDTQIYNLGFFLFALAGSALLGFGTGLVLSALNFYLPVIEKLVPMVTRILFLTTGVFYSPSQMTAIYGDAIMWIPTANYIEMLRGVFVGPALAGSVKPTYIVSLTALLLVMGLLLERHVRPKREVT